MTRTTTTAWLMSVVCLLLFGCAAGPTYASIQSKIPAVASGRGRVFIYTPGASFRIYPDALRIDPDVLIDGQRVGSAAPGVVFFVDLPLGTHSLVCDQSPAIIHLIAGESHYVSLEVYNATGNPFLVAARLRPVLVDPDQGSQEILDYSYIGH